MTTSLLLALWRHPIISYSMETPSAPGDFLLLYIPKRILSHLSLRFVYSLVSLSRKLCMSVSYKHLLTVNSFNNIEARASDYILFGAGLSGEGHVRAI